MVFYSDENSVLSCSFLFSSVIDVRKHMLALSILGSLLQVDSFWVNFEIKNFNLYFSYFSWLILAPPLKLTKCAIGGL